PDVDRGGRVLADQHHRQTWHPPLGDAKLGNFEGNPGSKRGRRSLSVDNPCAHEAVSIKSFCAPEISIDTTWISSSNMIGEKSRPPKSGRILRIGREHGSVIRSMAV